MSKDLIVFFGYGYVAQHLAMRLAKQNFELLGTKRAPNVTSSPQGVKITRFDDHHPLPQEYLQRARAVIISIAPQEDVDVVLKHHAEDLRHAPHLSWVGYLSSSSVYGDHGAKWINETAPCLATHPVGTRRILAEQQWQEWQKTTKNIALTIFRLAGIYGEGRSILKSVNENKARRIIKKGQFFGRIHAQDAAHIIECAMLKNKRPCTLYNVCDDTPAPPQDVISYAAQLLGKNPPPDEPYEEVAPHLSPMMRIFYGGSKKLCNEKMKKELGIKLRYPSYKEGLSALMSEFKASKI